MESLKYTHFKFDKSFNLSLVLNLEKQINRQVKYKEIKEIVKFPNYAYKIENGIFEFAVSYVIYNNIYIPNNIQYVFNKPVRKKAYVF